MPVGEDGKFLQPVEFSRHLRKRPTLSEQVLKRELTRAKIGYEFVSQHRIGSYFVDFCCRTHKVVVELDGDSHENKQEEDELRDATLAGRGCIVLRFRNEVVLQHLDKVVATIKHACDGRPRWRY